MAKQLERRLSGLRKLDANKPDSSFLKFGINPFDTYGIEICDGETVAELIARINAQLSGEGLSTITANDITLQREISDYDDWQTVARVHRNKTIVQLEWEIQAEIRRVEKAIHKRDNPSASQKKRMQLKQQRKQQRQDALNKLSAEERKILGV